MKLKDISETFETDLQDPEFVQVYLEEALIDGGNNFLIALRNVVEANKSMTAEPLLGTSIIENLQFSSVEKILKALGLRLSIETEPTAKAS